MEVKVGDKVRYKGGSGWDLTNGKVYEVCDFYSGGFYVIDDAGDENGLVNDDYELVTPEEKDHAAIAAKHGITITVTIGEMTITYDGRK